MRGHLTQRAPGRTPSACPANVHTPPTGLSDGWPSELPSLLRAADAAWNPHGAGSGLRHVIAGGLACGSPATPLARVPDIPLLSGPRSGGSPCRGSRRALASSPYGSPSGTDQASGALRLCQVVLELTPFGGQVTACGFKRREGVPSRS